MEGKREGIAIDQPGIIYKDMKKGIKELEKKILDKAAVEAEQLITRAKKARQRIIRKAKEEEKVIEEEAIKKGEGLLEIEKRRIVSEKLIDERKESLTLRQKLFEFLITDVEERMLEMLKKGKFNDWIKSKCKEIIHAEKGGMTLITREEDKDIYEGIGEGIEDLEIEIESLESGFLLRGEGIEYDFRFHLLGENLIRENRNLIISMLGVDNG